MIVQNQIGGGGPKIPEGTFVIVKGYTNAGGNVSESFNVPLTGTYRITVVGSGGDGGLSDGDNNRGGGGGSGGWACSVLFLTQGSIISVTCNSSISSFGSYLSATSGGNGDVSTLGTGGTASGGNVRNMAGMSSTWKDGAYAGGIGAPVRDPSYSLFLTDATGLAGDRGSSGQDGNFPISTGIFNSFGAGGGGAWRSTQWYYYGGPGGPGAVIIELLLEGVNT